MKLFYSNVFKNYFLITMVLFLSEMIFRIFVGYSFIDFAVLRIFVGCNAIGLLFGTLFSFFGRIGGNILSLLFTFFMSVYAVFEISLYNYFGVFMSVSLLDRLLVVSDYITDFLGCFKIYYLLIFFPFVLQVLFYLHADGKIKVMERNDCINFADKFDSEERKKMDEERYRKTKKKKRINNVINGFVVTLAFCGAYFYTLTSGMMQSNLQVISNKDLFLQPNYPNLAVGNFGYSVYLGIDIKDNFKPSKVGMDTDFDSGYKRAEQVLSDYIREVDDSVWEEVVKEEKNSSYKKLNNYFYSRDIYDKNHLTGIFKGKNLIIIEAESLSNLANNKQFFPNLSKLFEGGWYFENAYSPRNSCSTGNNELSAITSLYSVNSRCSINKYSKNVYPESIFKLFSEMSYTTTSFHNYTDNYYDRSVAHANFGSGHYYGVQELGIPYSNDYVEWPSDVELMEKYLSITEDDKKNMTFMTTVSTDGPYGKVSEFGNLYLDLFKGNNYNTSIMRYMSKLKVLDNAIGVLLEGLEKQGKLDDTVIVLFSSNSPYELNIDSLGKAYGYSIKERREIDRTPFVIYNSETKEQVFKQYISYIDIVPTLANLFDLEFDPRLYIGHDVFSSTYDDRIIFSDGSWQDKKAFFDASKNKLIYFDVNEKYTEKEFEEINKRVFYKVYMSNLAIKTNYFNVLYNKIEEKKVALAEAEEQAKSS